MKISGRKFHHLNLKVTNLDEAIKYYTETLGFSFLGKYEGSFLDFAFVTDGNITYELIADENLTKGYFDHVAYTSDDINADYEYYKALGLTTTEIGFVDYLFENGVYYFFIKGVNDERIEICQNA